MACARLAQLGLQASTGHARRRKLLFEGNHLAHARCSRGASPPSALLLKDGLCRHLAQLALVLSIGLPRSHSTRVHLGLRLLELLLQRGQLPCGLYLCRGKTLCALHLCSLGGTHSVVASGDSLHELEADGLQYRSRLCLLLSQRRAESTAPTLKLGEQLAPAAARLACVLAHGR